jgi:hypothetical protein
MDFTTSHAVLLPCCYAPDVCFPVHFYCFRTYPQILTMTNARMADQPRDDVRRRDGKRSRRIKRRIRRIEKKLAQSREEMDSNVEFLFSSVGLSPHSISFPVSMHPHGRVLSAWISYFGRQTAQIGRGASAFVTPQHWQNVTMSNGVVGRSRLNEAKVHSNQDQKQTRVEGEPPCFFVQMHLFSIYFSWGKHATNVGIIHK